MCDKTGLMSSQESLSKKISKWSKSKELMDIKILWYLRADFI